MTERMKRHMYGPRVVGQEAYDEHKAEQKAGGHKYGKRVTDPEWYPGKYPKDGKPPRTAVAQAPEQLTPPFRPTLQQSISALEKDLQQVHLLPILDQLFTEEQDGQNRKGVYRLLDARRQELLSAQAISVATLSEVLNKSVEELDDFIAMELSRPLPRQEALELFREFEVASKGRVEMLEVLSAALERVRQHAEQEAAEARAVEADALFDKKTA